jgi:ribonuclease HII
MRDSGLSIKQDALFWAAGRPRSKRSIPEHLSRRQLAMRRAVEGLTSQPDFILADARRIPYCQTPRCGIIKGDTLSASIAAASIIAKTTRCDHD